MFDWMTQFVQDAGYLGVFLLMLAENLFPPIPSELIMPLAGFNAARGSLSLAGVLFAGTAGAIAGAVFWYAVGRALGYPRLRRLAASHGRWMTVGPEDLDRARSFFDRHAGPSVFLGRCIPAVRTLISIPAGVSPMPLAAFVGWTALGTAAWTALLTGAGYLLEDRYVLVAQYLNPVSTAVTILLLAAYFYRVVTFRT